MKLKRKPFEERKSFIRAISNKISTKENLVSRVSTAIGTGCLTGLALGPIIPWGIVISDGIVRKKPFSWTNLRDYSIFKASATAVNPEEIKFAWNFLQDQYHMLEYNFQNIKYLVDQAINYF